MENDHPETRREDRGRGSPDSGRGPFGGGFAGRARARLKAFLLRFLTYRRAEALKGLLAGLLYYSGAAWLIGRFRRRGAAILMYHSVGCRDAFQDNVISEREFEDQIAYLSRRRRIVRLDDVLDRLEAGAEVPDDWVALTFDDGYADNRRTALPILEKYGAAATFFPAVRAVEAGRPFFYDDIERLVRAAGAEVTVDLGRGPVRFHLPDDRRREDAALRMVLEVRGRPPAERDSFVETLRRRVGTAGARPAAPLYLAPEDVRALAAAGMEIGSHTLSHPNLAGLKNGELQMEVAVSKSRLEAMTGKPVRGFAYPFGKRRHIGAFAREAVRRAGYRYAVTTEFGRVGRGADPFALPRLAPRGPVVRLKVNLLGVAL